MDDFLYCDVTVEGTVVRFQLDRSQVPPGYEAQLCITIDRAARTVMGEWCIKSPVQVVRDVPAGSGRMEKQTFTVPAAPHVQHYGA